MCCVLWGWDVCMGKGLYRGNDPITIDQMQKASPESIIRLRSQS